MIVGIVQNISPTVGSKINQVTYHQTKVFDTIVILTIPPLRRTAYTVISSQLIDYINIFRVSCSVKTGILNSIIHKSD